MAYKTIVVSLNDVKRAPVILGIASALAARHGSHVTGVYVVPAVQVYPAVAMQITPEIVDAQRRYFEDEAANVRAIFEDIMARNDIVCEWRRVDAIGSIIADTVIDHGRYADLIIAGQVDPDSDAPVEIDMCERVLLESGRPCLFVPAHGTFDKVGSVVTVAWNATRESARAAFDALPILTDAKEVHILWVNPSAEDGRSIALAGSEIAVSLSRHGVNVQTHHSINDEIDVGDDLLSRVADEGSNMLVMGGYGHSRFREMVFGGATRHILRHMTVPILISH